MLINKFIKIPDYVECFFYLIKKNKYIVFQNKKNKIRQYVRITDNIVVLKKESFITLSSLQSIDLSQILSHIFLILQSLRLPCRKTLIFRGLGLRIVKEQHQYSSIYETYVFKLGFSHDISYQIPVEIEINIFKKSLTLVSYNRILLGNIANKIINLQKANCYKSKPLALKIIRKN